MPIDMIKLRALQPPDGCPSRFAASAMESYRLPIWDVRCSSIRKPWDPDWHQWLCPAGEQMERNQNA